MKDTLLTVTIISNLLWIQQGHAQQRLYPQLFPQENVVLLDGPFKHARDLNIQTLLQYKTDRLLAPFRKEAGLPVKDTSYPNWDGLDGHVGGHYLSAMAMNYAATNNNDCLKRMNYMLGELQACQQANSLQQSDWAVGYAGGVPNSKTIWMALKKGDLAPYRNAWVPWYNLHKIYAGLRDAWVYTGSELAKEMFLRFCDWAIFITSDLSEQQFQAMLDVEHGGMNEVLADAYKITGDEKYRLAAIRFSHRALMEPLAKGVDNLDNKHANTQVPKAVGFHRIGHLTNEEAFSRAGSFFWETVTTNRTLAFGGNSRREFFPGINACSDFVSEVEGPETCNSYNMLKLTQSLFAASPSAHFVDYYERTLYNHILSSQHPEHGGYVYFTPARPQHYRVYSTPNNAMWCCVGSGMENHGKYNELIYTHRNDSLYLNLFIPSELNWKEKGIILKQETNFPNEGETQLIIQKASSSFTLMVRYPGWVKASGLEIFVNGKKLTHETRPSSYVAVKRNWKKGDVVKIKLPMQHRLEQMPHMPEYIAFLYGPILLAAPSGTEDLKGLKADDGRWAHIASGKRLPIDQAPILIENDRMKITNALSQVKDKSLHFKFSGIKMINETPLELKPFYQVHDTRYMMYWMALTDNQYQNYIDSIAQEEKIKLELQERTVDRVVAGEQQPEADHQLKQHNSHTGNRQDEFWREARNGGFFSYQLSTGGQSSLSLLVRYWGAEWGQRKFDIYINDEKLLTEDNTGRWNQSKFIDVSYNITEKMLEGRQTVEIKFQALPGNTAGAVYSLRLLKEK